MASHLLQRYRPLSLQPSRAHCWVTDWVTDWVTVSLVLSDGVTVSLVLSDGVVIFIPVLAKSEWVSDEWWVSEWEWVSDEWVETFSSSRYWSAQNVRNDFPKSHQVLNRRVGGLVKDMLAWQVMAITVYGDIWGCTNSIFWHNDENGCVCVTANPATGAFW
jgi:hypothetical protein